jgi:hypothetical protein
VHRDASVEALLRWRAAHTEADVPPPPSAAQLLDLVRPWWERDPVQFRVRATRVRRMPLAMGYAMTGGERGRKGGLVPAILSAELEVETYVQMLYVSVLHGRLRLRFALDVDGIDAFRSLDTTFIADGADSGLFVAVAERSQSGEFRIDVALPAELAVSWERLKATDQLPFRLLLQPRVEGTGPTQSPAGEA